MIAALISRETLLNVVKNLPAAPQILAQLGRLLLDINSDLSDIAHLLKRDAALTAQIIRISNSAVYNTGLPFASLEEVYRITGFAVVAQLADQHLPLYGMSGVQLRENALLTALIMEAAAPGAGLDAREAYTAGLLRSTGKIALDRLFKGRRIVFAGGAGGEDLAAWETAHLGITNAEASALILADWRFPADTVEAIRDHYLEQPSSFALTRLLNLAAGAAELRGQGLPGEAKYWAENSESYTAAGIGPDAFERSLESAMRLFNAARAAVS
jgi:HD-like signal output (HDOD) protein